MNTPQLFTVNYNDDNHRLGMAYSITDKHKNNFYYAFDLNLDFAWNNDFNMLYGFYMGFGGMFLDSRDEQGLAGRYGRRIRSFRPFAL